MLTNPHLSQFRRIRRFLPVLWALLHFDRPLTESEISTVVGMNCETVRTHLRCLSREGLVARLGRYNGWILTAGGSQLLLPSPSACMTLPLSSQEDQPGPQRGKPALDAPNNPRTRKTRAENESERGKTALPNNPRTRKTRAENESERGKSALVAETTLQALDPGEPRTRKTRVENESERGKSALDTPIKTRTREIRAENENERGKSALDPLEEEDLNLKNLDLDSSSSKTSLQNLDVRQILESVEELFGEPVTGSPKDYKNPARLLAWIAYAHNHRRGLRHPSRLVYRSYRKDEDPDPEYLDHPEDHLPDWFLARLGLLDPDSEDDDCDDFEDDPHSEDPEDPCDPLPENPNFSPQAAHWWSACCEQLKYQLGTPKFNDWIRDLRPWDWDPEISLLTLVAPTAYTRDCVESRLKAIIQRILAGIANRVVTIRITTHPRKGEEPADPLIHAPPP